MPISHIKAYHTMLLLIIQEKIKEPVIKEQIARLKPAHEAYWNVTPIKKTISIKIDADILAVLQSLGKGYQTRINSILRKAITTGDY